MLLEIFENAFEDIKECINYILEWTSDVTEVEQFTNSTYGMMKLDAVSMRLQVIGELLKNVDKRDREFLSRYKGVEWEDVMKLRDIISHHYTELNASIIFSICKNDIPQLEKTVSEILIDLRKQINSTQ